MNYRKTKIVVMYGYEVRTLKQITDYKPVNNGFYCKSVSLRN